MRDHSECEAAIEEAQRRDKQGLAMFRAARCDMHHGPQMVEDVATTTTTEDSE